MGLTSAVKIEIDGQAVKDFVGLTITQSIYDHHEFEVKFRKETLEKPNTFLMEASKDFIGTSIKIEIEDYQNNYKNSTPALFFRGIVTDIRATRSGVAETNFIFISGYSPDILLEDNPGCRSFQEMDLNQLVSKVLKPIPKDLLRCNLAPTIQTNFNYIVQYNESSYSFLRRLAARYGQWFFYDGLELLFGEVKPQTVNVCLGMDLTDFGFSLKVSPHNFKNISYNSVSDGDNMSQFTPNSEKSSKMLNDYGKLAFQKSMKLYGQSSVLLNNHLNVTDSNYQTELQKVTELTGSGIAAGMSGGTGTSVNPKIKLGSKLTIQALSENAQGKLDYGEYLVTSIIHKCDNLNNYTNEFRCVPAKATIPDYTDALAFPHCETQYAVVTNNTDPDNLGRVRVRFFWQLAGEESPWIRVSHPHAGNNSGFYFIPELNEEVIVGFESGDAEKPFVMGSLFNGVNKPDGSWPSGSNDNKVIRTRGGNTIELIDNDGSEEINIYQENDKADSHHISMVLASKLNPLAESEMTIFSKGKLVIQAESIEIQSKGAIDIKSKEDSINVDAAKNVALKSKIGMTMDADKYLIAKSKKAVKVASEGTLVLDGKRNVSTKAGVKNILKGETMVEIKGGIVKIN